MKNHGSNLAQACIQHLYNIHALPSWVANCNFEPSNKSQVFSTLSSFRYLSCMLGSLLMHKITQYNTVFVHCCCYSMNTSTVIQMAQQSSNKTCFGWCELNSYYRDFKCLCGLACLLCSGHLSWQEHADGFPGLRSMAGRADLTPTQFEINMHEAELLTCDLEDPWASE